MRNGTSWGKKEQACTDEEKEEHGDQWDHVVIDSESKAIISMVCGKRTKENTEALIQDFASRCNNEKPPKLFTTDDYPCYEDVSSFLCMKNFLPNLAS